MNLKLLLCALLAVMLAVMAACGDDDDGSSSGSATQTGTPRPTAPLSLPDDFPADFPLYSDMSLDQGARFENQVLAAFASGDGLGDVTIFYRTELAEDPWTITRDENNALGTVTTIAFRHSDGETRGTLTLSEPSAGAGTQINTSFIVPVFASPLPTAVPTEAASEAEAESPTPEEEATE